MSASNPPLGLACALAVVCIWSSFIVISRAGVTTALTVYDVTALRFLVAGAITAPFVWAWWPSHLSLKAVIILAASGPGALYSLIMYFGLNEASAAYAGVFANGSLPIFTMLLVFACSGIHPKRNQLLAVFFIILGAASLSYPDMVLEEKNVGAGIALFLSSSAILSVYALGVKYWQLTPRQALVLVNVPSALVFLPIWYIFLPSGLDEVQTSTIMIQALFQGIGPGILGIIFFALATVHLGPTPTTGIMAAVPATAAFLAIPTLGEIPNTLEWTGIGLATVGLLLLIRGRNREI